MVGSKVGVKVGSSVVVVACVGETVMVGSTVGSRDGFGVVPVVTMVGSQKVCQERIVSRDS